MAVPKTALEMMSKMAVAKTSVGDEPVHGDNNDSGLWSGMVTKMPMTLA